jgi:NADPH-dependent 2,4-dienoyl-CoA reductase/sulfur reductase-like enzyme
MRRIVVVGGSLAGHHATRALRTLGYDGEVTVVAAEPHHPYDRHLLSKAFLTDGLDAAALELPLADAEAAWLVGATATGLDMVSRHVTLDNGTHIPFDGLVVASGARARDEALGAGVPGVLVLRTLDDGVALRKVLTGPPRRVVVVGGGLIGAEVSSAVVAAGHHTTLVAGGEVPTSHALGQAVAEHLLHKHRERGVRVVTGARMARLDLGPAGVTGAVLVDGRKVAGDVVVLATGTRPNTEWLHGSGLQDRDGLFCRPTLHAQGHDRVVGAGDVVRFRHPVLGGAAVRLEHWWSAVDQATHAAASLLSGPDSARPFQAFPLFSSTIHDIGIRSLGFPQAADTSRVVWGSLDEGAAVIALGLGGRFVAAVAVNAAGRVPPLEDQLRRGVPLDAVRVSAGPDGRGQASAARVSGGAAGRSSLTKPTRA